MLGFAAVVLAGLAGTVGASRFGGSKSRATADESPVAGSAVDERRRRRGQRTDRTHAPEPRPPRARRRAGHVDVGTAAGRGHSDA